MSGSGSVKRPEYRRIWKSVKGECIDPFEYYRLSLQVIYILMFRNRNLLIVSVILVLVLFAFLSFPVIYSVSGSLSKTSRVDANILVIEGWLPPYAIDLGYNEFKNGGYDFVITTGIGISGYYEVSMNGYLIFYTEGRFKKTDIIHDHILEIDAFGTTKEEIQTHFNVYVNDSLVADFFAATKKRLYQINWRGNPETIDSVMIQFDNDSFDRYGDRNLYVKEIVFNNMTHIPYQQNSEYDIGELDGKRRVANNFTSHAEIAANVLLSSGIDSSKVIAITGKEVKINRTLSSALAFRDWLETTDTEVKGINIVTLGIHAGRTRMTYNKILDKKYKIGIISIPDNRENSSGKYKIFKTIRESFGLVYYWIILLPF